MSNNSNNSGNTPDPQQVLSWNGGGWQTVNIPAATPPTNASNSIFIPNTIYTITVGGGSTSAGQQVQIQLPNIEELDLPVAENKKNSDGCVCKKCKELFPYAEPNQDDGTLICYGCRMVW